MLGFTGSSPASGGIPWALRPAGRGRTASCRLLAWHTIPQACWLNIQCVLQVLVNLHDRCLVTASVAVVGS